MNKKSLRVMISRSCTTLLLLLISIAPISAQTQSGLQIRVVDSNQNVVKGATVTLINKGTNQSRSATTSDEGEAVFKGVVPGTYDIVATKSGFADGAVSDLQIVVGQQKSVEVILNATVFLSAIDIEEQEDRGEQISALPNLNNDLTPLLQTIPGSIATGPAALGRVIIDGKGNEQRTLRLDGVDFNVLVDLPATDVAIDAVQSLQKPEVAGILDSPSTSSGAFAAMVGPGTGTVVDTPTYKSLRETSPVKKSLWRLQVFEELRNDGLNARNFFDFDGKNGLRRHRFGGKFGTPLDKRDKKFLFFAYDGLRGRIERNVYEAIPIDAVCGCATGPLATLVRGYLPNETQVVPGASLNPDFAVARRRTRSTSASNAVDFRFDYYPFSNAKKNNELAPKSFDVVTLRFTRQQAENVVPDGVTGRQQRQRFTFTNALVSLKSVSSTKLAPNQRTKEFGHTFRFGFNETRARVNIENPPAFASDLPESTVTLGGTVNTTGLPGSPASVPIAALGGLVKSTGRGLDLKPRSIGGSYDYSRQVGAKHELFTGVEVRSIRLDFDRLGGLTYAFPNLAALRAGTPGTITYLSDLSGPGPFSNGTGPRQARQEFYMGYFQMSTDFRKASDPGDPQREPAVKLTYGIRYDYFTTVRERDHRAVIVDPQTANFLPPGTSFYRTEKFNFQPRIGLVYRFDESENRFTVLRVGFGLYSGVPRTGDLLLPIESDRFSTGISGGSFPANPTSIINQFIANPDTRQFQPVTMARDFKVLERAYKWDVQLTRTIEGYDLSAIYSGNIGRNLPLANIANRIVSVVTNPDPSKPAIVVREFDIVRGGNVFKPFGEFFYRTGGGQSSYHGLTFQLKRNTDVDVKSSLARRWNQAVKSFNLQYTISRSVGNASGTVLSDPFHVESDFGFNGGDIRHSFKLSAAYDLWAARADTSDKPANILLGWKIMPVLKVSSGFPLTIRINRPDVVYIDSAGNVFASPAAGRTAVINTPGGGESGSARVPDLIPGVSPNLRGSLEILNPAAFAIPAPGKFGNFRRGSLRGLPIIQLDIGLRKNLFDKPVFKNETKVSGQLQVDFYNVFNRANFINPTASLPGLLGTSTADNQLQPGVPFSRSTAGTFGVISAADVGRIIQFSFTLRFNDGFTK